MAEPAIRIRPALPDVKVPAEQATVKDTAPLKLAKAITDVTAGITLLSEIVRPLNDAEGAALIENGAVPFEFVEPSICTVPNVLATPVGSFNFAKYR